VLAVIVIFLQAYLAILFARYIRPDIIILLREVGSGIFER
jgi:hypothetical protein